MDSEDNSKDGDYIPHTNGSVRPRPSYESARQVVENRQEMTQTARGWHFKSAISGKKIKLGPNKEDPTYRDIDGNTRQPALDHLIQYAAIDKVYEETLESDRKEKKRRGSLVIHNAFVDAVRDPENLRLLTHAEHVKAGTSMHKVDFSNSYMVKAEKHFKSHLNKQNTPTQVQLNAFDTYRPASAIPKSTTNPFAGLKTYDLRKRSTSGMTD